MTQTLEPEDARVQRTRTALVTAFNRSLLAHGYEALRPGAIASAAGVARSTFYEHFDSKAALLRHATAPILIPLARTVRSPIADPSLTATIEHFWKNRRLARTVLTGRTRAIVQTLLADLIDHELGALGCAPLIPGPLVAAQLAHGQLGLIELWLAGRHPCSASAIGIALHRIALANVRALVPAAAR